MRKQTAENRLRSRIAVFIASANLEPDANFMCHASHRYRFTLAIEPEAQEESKLYKRIALDLVFRSAQLVEMEQQGDWLLTNLFRILAERYVTGNGKGGV